MQQASAAQKRGDYVTAVREYADVLKRKPDFAPAYLNLGLVEFEQHHYGEAAAHFRTAVRLDSRLGAAWLFEGLSLYQIGDNASARQSLEKARELMPNDPQAARVLGEVYRALGRYQDSAEALEKASRLKPNDPETLYSLAQTYLQLAREQQQRILEIDPGNYRVYVMLAQLYEQQNDLPAAVSEYTEMLRLYPHRSDGHLLLGNLFERMGQPDKAAAEYQAVVTLNPDNAEALLRLASLDLKEHRTAAALAKARHVLDVNSHSALARKIAGQCLLANGQSREAVEQLQQSIQADPSDASNHFLLAKALRQAGDSAQAEREMSTFETMNKQSEEATTARARRLQNALAKTHLAAGDTPARQ